jgi:hypothetical protein
MEADIKSKPGPARFSAIEFMGDLFGLFFPVSLVPASELP